MNATTTMLPAALLMGLLASLQQNTTPTPQSPETASSDPKTAAVTTLYGVGVLLAYHVLKDLYRFARARFPSMAAVLVSPAASTLVATLGADASADARAIASGNPLSVATVLSQLTAALAQAAQHAATAKDLASAEGSPVSPPQ